MNTTTQTTLIEPTPRRELDAIDLEAEREARAVKQLKSMTSRAPKPR